MHINRSIKSQSYHLTKHVNLIRHARPSECDLNQSFSLQQPVNHSLVV